MSKEPSKSAFLRVAGKQHGALSRSQALACGISAWSVDRRVASGDFEVILPGVYGVVGAPKSWHQRLVAACLWAGQGSVCSHRSAAALWGLDGCQPDFVEITTPRRLRSDEVLVHQSQLNDRDSTLIGSIPTTDVCRTLIDLGAVTAPEVVESALDDALRRGLTSLRRLRWRLEQLGGRGRRGVAVLRTLLDERDPKAAPAESVLEARLIRLLRRARLPEPAKQHEVRERGRLLARVDLAYPDVRLAIEADGYRFHSGRVAWQRDLERRNALTSRGWRVIHVTWNDVTSNGDEIVAQIRRALGEAGQLSLAPGERAGRG